LAAFETVEHSLGREENEAAFVACDDSGCAVIDFDDVGSGHRYSFTEMPALLSDNDAGFNPIWSPTSSDRRSEATSGNALARISVHLLVGSHAIDLHSPLMAPTIRRCANLVNEMTVQFWPRNTRFVLWHAAERERRNFWLRIDRNWRR
jgi:hypothetical protein